jgi:cyanate permease
MEGSRTRAGGCFLTIFILVGFLYGPSIQNPLKGTLIGVGVGAIFAIITWLIDLRRRGS